MIAIGGGSVLDYAKISAVINLEKNLKYKIINNSLNLTKNYRLLAIPQLQALEQKLQKMP